MFLTIPTKERLAAIRGTAPGRHTYLECAPLQAQSPGLSVSANEPVRSFYLLLPVLTVVESFPGAMSLLGSKEPNELFL